MTRRMKYSPRQGFFCAGYRNATKRYKRNPKLHMKHEACHGCQQYELITLGFLNERRMKVVYYFMCQEDHCSSKTVGNRQELFQSLHVPGPPDVLRTLFFF